MAPPFEIVDKEYIEEFKYNSGKVNKKKSTEYWPEDRFQKEGEWKKLPENLEEDESIVLENCRSFMQPKIQCFPLYVINK